MDFPLYIHLNTVVDNTTGTLEKKEICLLFNYTKPVLQADNKKIFTTNYTSFLKILDEKNNALNLEYDMLIHNNDSDQLD